MNRPSPESLNPSTEHGWPRQVLDLDGYFEQPLCLPRDVFVIDTSAGPQRLTPEEERTVEHRRIWLGFLSLWHVDVDSYRDLIGRMSPQSLELFETYYEDVMDLLAQQRTRIHDRRSELEMNMGFTSVDQSAFPGSTSATDSDS